MPIGTARMASLCLPESELHVGVRWADHAPLRAALSDPARPPILLYPGPGARDILTEPPAGPVTLVEPIADKVGGRYTQQVTLPTTPCNNCTLQLMQIMTTTEPYNSFYYQCADIVISGDVPPPDNGGGESGGCSTSRGGGLGVAVALGLLLRRRRR